MYAVWLSNNATRQLIVNDLCYEVSDVCTPPSVLAYHDMAQVQHNLA